MIKKDEHQERITKTVREKYGNLAEKQISGAQSGSCCGGSLSCGCGDSGLAEPATDLYAAEDIITLPESVTGISLGCGSPTAIADLKKGQTVLDLGSGGGIDCFLAAKKVGPRGQVIGLDMTPTMIDLARANAKKMDVKNVDFRYGFIEDIPLPDGSVDVIISNCVINLSADKGRVFREALRVLKPGGVLNLSDIVTYGSMPAALSQQLSAWAGCVSGALDEEVYLDLMRQAGFARIDVLERKFYPPNLIAGDEGMCALLRENTLKLEDLEGKIASMTLRAVK